MSNPVQSIKCEFLVPMETARSFLLRLIECSGHWYGITEKDIPRLSPEEKDVDFKFGPFVFYYRLGDPDLHLLLIEKWENHLFPDLFVEMVPFVREGSYIDLIYLDTGKIQRYKFKNKGVYFIPLELVENTTYQRKLVESMWSRTKENV